MLTRPAIGGKQTVYGNNMECWWILTSEVPRENLLVRWYIFRVFPRTLSTLLEMYSMSLLGLDGPSFSLCLTDRQGKWGEGDYEEKGAGRGAWTLLVTFSLWNKESEEQGWKTWWCSWAHTLATLFNGFELNLELRSIEEETSTRTQRNDSSNTKNKNEHFTQGRARQLSCFVWCGPSQLFYFLSYWTKKEKEKNKQKRMNNCVHMHLKWFVLLFVTLHFAIFWLRWTIQTGHAIDPSIRWAHVLSMLYSMAQWPSSSRFSWLCFLLVQKCLIEDHLKTTRKEMEMMCF